MEMNRQEVKGIFKDYKHLTLKQKKYLTSHGFQIMSERKHWIIMHPKCKNHVVLSKSASDYRTGRNFASTLMANVSHTDFVS